MTKKEIMFKNICCVKKMLFLLLGYRLSKWNEKEGDYVKKININ